MKFMLHLNPVVSVSPAERERLRPIAHCPSPIARKRSSRCCRRWSSFLFCNLHSKFCPQIPENVEPLVEAGMVFAGTGDDVRPRMAEMQEKRHPEYFLWVCDQGYLPLDEVKRQLELFGTRVMNEFKG